MTNLPINNKKDKFDFIHITHFLTVLHSSISNVSHSAFFHLRIVRFPYGSKENRIGWPAAENVLGWLGVGFPLGRLVIDERRRGADSRLISPLGKDTFVQVHHDRILRFQFAIEKASHVTAGSDGILGGEKENNEK